VTSPCKNTVMMDTDWVISNGLGTVKVPFLSHHYRKNDSSKW
jgi:hypothetical protein